MEKKTYLIIGGAGEAGQSAIEFLKEDDENSIIIASTSEKSNIPGADLILTDIKAEVGIEKNVKAQINLKGYDTQIEAIIYTPALGEVGYPIRMTTLQAYEKALEISYYPLLALENEFSPKLSIGYSAFYWLPHSLAFYGSMGYVKLKMDEWVLENPSKRKMIRAGTFFSKSVRGISILLQRTMKKTEDKDLLILKREFESSGLKFQDFFLEYAWKNEEKFFSNQEHQTPYRHTERNDLGHGLKLALTTNEPIITVLGDWNWFENELPKRPEWFDIKNLA